MATDLADMKCVPCSSGAQRMSREEINQMRESAPAWSVIEVDGEERLQRVFYLDNFIDALEFANLIGRVAEENDHHPSLLVEWGKLTVTWWTHKIKGLFKNDFIMAAKTDELAEEQE